MAKCHLSWDSYKKNVCNGFSHLQQQEEFVDMTLVAEGHLVKVHKTLMALASPYLKEVLQSAPCQHPVIFLTHISHDILGYIVEYVYTGEVVVPSHRMDTFIKAAKALNIVGIQNLIPPSKCISTHLRLGADIDSSEENGTLVNHVEKNHTVAGFKILRAPINNLLIKNTYSLANTGDCNLIVNQDNNLISQNNLTSEDFIEENHTQQLTSQSCENVTYSSHFENFVNSTASGIPQNSDEPNINQTNQLSADINNHYIVPDSMEHTGDTIDNMDIESQDEGPEHSKTVTTLETSKNRDYSIKLEMPNGNTGPPKITIQAAVVENVNADINPPNVGQHHVFKNPIVSNAIPKITINAGMIEDTPNITISNDSCPIEADKLKESLTSNASSPLYIQSGKGRLQMILNRYIYGVHHGSRRGIRWRCIDYRHNRCPAFVDTVGDKIVSRKFIHNHPFHDDKILHKGLKKRVFESLEEVSKACKHDNDSPYDEVN